jgi:hypothetical protein
MKTTQKEASQELAAVQKTSPFPLVNSLRQRRIVEIVGGHVHHPDIPDSRRFAAGDVKNILGNNRFLRGLDLSRRQVHLWLVNGNYAGFAAGGPLLHGMKNDTRNQVQERRASW